MKKLMILAAVAAMAFGAKAEYSCELYVSFVVNANGDENPSSGVIRGGYYQAFIIQNAGADVNAVANYVKGKTVAEIASEAKVTYNFSASEFSGGQYKYTLTDASQSDEIDIDPYHAYLVSFYGTPNETPTEFCVVANYPDWAESDELSFDDVDCATSGWQTYTGPSPAPEPTSGLMMLIGLAGLALKRKVVG